MGYPAENGDHRYTFGDYLSWPDGERWELINGIASAMTPAPSTQHQKILVEVTRQFSNFFLEKPCDVFAAPFDVRLPRGDEKDELIDTVVQPDIVVVCDPTKIDEKGCKGAPDLVVEIVSPSTVQKDLKEKMALYERAGVKEYWIIHPSDKTVMLFKLGPYRQYGRPEILTKDDPLQVELFEELAVDLKLVFKE
jgi:Uma2 family endonuclease